MAFDLPAFPNPWDSPFLARIASPLEALKILSPNLNSTCPSTTNRLSSTFDIS